MKISLRRELYLLRAYVLFSSSLLIMLGFGAFRYSRQQRFDVITAERINIVDRNGTLRLVLSNKTRMPAPTVRGKTFGQEGSRPAAGLVFYNDEGSENGGLIFAGQQDSSKTGYDQGLSLTFDQYNQDQVIALQHMDDGRTRVHGLAFLDRPLVPLDSMIELQQKIRSMPEGPAREAAQRHFVEMQKLPGRNSWAVPRLFIGRERSTASLVRLNDQAGRPRIRMIVDSVGSARLEFLDTLGKVTHTLPQ